MDDILALATLESAAMRGADVHGLYGMTIEDGSGTFTMATLYTANCKGMREGTIRSIKDVGGNLFNADTLSHGLFGHYLQDIFSFTTFHGQNQDNDVFSITDVSEIALALSTNYVT